ncbi:MAG: RagB/SusD family nutrient uptake outer membrane protein [Prevotella sp.]|nr:RagB/SusD family nutrient uptake outer membrane protein [Prevotella sp.]MCM1074143.1 RagB/SusD family nutrient uptake outer membrane protein [Ruminococcus sp.]
MNIKKIIKNTALVGLGALMMTSCASDYLDTPVHGVTQSDQIASTTDKARQTLLGAVVSMCVPNSNQLFAPPQCFWQGETGMSYYLGELPGSDNYLNFMYDASPGWIILYNQEPSCFTTGTYVWVRSCWLYTYAIIGQLNELLYYIDNAEGPAEEREFTKGQAYAMRAHCYWRLMQIYGPRWEDAKNGEQLSSIVLRTTIGEPDNKAVATTNEVYNQMYSDLNNAIEAFSKAGSTKRVLNYEPTLNTAYGTYARVAAMKHDWAKCREMANKARQGYRLATVNEGMSGYNSFNDNEWMWAPSFDNVDNMIYGNWCTFFACNSYGAINGRYTNSINITLYRQIPETDKRRDWWMTVDKLVGVNEKLAYNARAVNAVNQQFTAPALVNAARTWLDKRQNDYNNIGLAAYNGTGAGTEASYVLRDGAQVKFWCDGLTGNNQMCQIPFMRATEMYLYEAEACAELGLTGEAQALLNEINKNYNPSYNCTATGQDLIDEVRLYRRVELWGEGFCWFDLKRWNIPMERIGWEAGNTQSGNIPPDLATKVPVTRNAGWRYCVPLEERVHNNEITVPIPGVDLGEDAE